MSLASEGLPGRHRLRRRFEYRAVQSKGRRFVSRSFLGFYLLDRKGDARLGVTVSRKVGNAVQRNRMKRLVREWFRRAKTTLPKGVDLVLIFRHGVGEIPAIALRDELRAFESALGRLGARA